MILFDTVIAAWKIAKANREARKDAAERANIAKAFNDRYTYRMPWADDSGYLPGTSYGMPPRTGYAWMCPKCNKIHLAIQSSVWDGLHYPACCNHREGNRLYDDIRSR